MQYTVDVAVVGSRCAGSSLAMLLARAGRSVLVVDRGRFPSDRLSTHLLQSKGVHFLREWGLADELADLGVPRVPLMRFNFGEWWIDLAREPEEGAPPAYVCAPRRTLLDAMLVDAARDAGATVLEGTRVVELRWDGGRVCGFVATSEDGTTHEVAARVVVGADGLHSMVSKAVGADVLFESPDTTCQVYAYWEGIDQDYMELGLRPGCAFGAFLCDQGQVLVSVSRPVSAWHDLWQGGDAAYRGVLEEWFPATAVRVFQGRRVSPLKGTNDLPNVLRRAAGPGWALAGDAAMHKDPVTGLGISDAFHAAAALADELAPALDEADAAVDAATERATRRVAEATRPTFDVAVRCASYDFTEPELPGVVIGMHDAVRLDLSAVTGETATLLGT